MKTEEEARKTRCCAPVGCGRLMSDKSDFAWLPGELARFCIGSYCMAWRWTGPEPEKLDGFETGYRGKKQPERRGFCGLAGKP